MDFESTWPEERAFLLYCGWSFPAWAFIAGAAILGYIGFTLAILLSMIPLIVCIAVIAYGICRSPSGWKETSDDVEVECRFIGR